LPQTERIEFKTTLQKGNRIQIPKLIQTKFQPNQPINVTIHLYNSSGTWQKFYAKTDKQGRIFIPKLTINLLSKGQDLTGHIFEITLTPA
jgi:hypothetical protein